MRPSTIACAAALATAATPAAADGPSGPSWAMVIAGSALVVAARAAPVAIAAGYDFADGGEWLGVPLAGPFIYLGVREGCDESDDELTGATCAFGDVMLTIVVVADALAQIGGHALIIGGLAAITPSAAPIDGGGWVPAIAGSF